MMAYACDLSSQKAKTEEIMNLRSARAVQYTKPCLRYLKLHLRIVTVLFPNQYLSHYTYIFYLGKLHNCQNYLQKGRPEFQITYAFIIHIFIYSYKVLGIIKEHKGTHLL